jgi:hypothetical protein
MLPGLARPTGADGRNKHSDGVRAWDDRKQSQACDSVKLSLDCDSVGVCCGIAMQ